MRRSIALGTAVLLVCSAAWAQRPLTEEETIAPLVMKQGCWGGIIRYIEEDRTFEVRRHGLRRWQFLSLGI